MLSNPMGFGVKQVIDEPELRILPSGLLFNMSSGSVGLGIKQKIYGLELPTLPPSPVGVF